MITEKNLEISSLDDWVEEFKRLYFPNKDSKRSVSYMWLHLIENASKVGEGMRRNEWGKAFKELAHVFAWLCSFVAKCQEKDLQVNNIDEVYLLDEPFSEIIFFHYPNVCGTCGWSPCRCSIWRKKIETDPKFKKIIMKQLALQRKKQHEKPTTLDGWVEMFRRIYENADYGYPIEYICFHFMEEVGEVAKAILELQRFVGKDLSTMTNEDSKKLTKWRKNLKEELSHVFAWIASLVMKLQFHSDRFTEYYEMKTMENKLSEIMLKEYKSPVGGFLYCPPPYCKKRVCECPNC